MPTDAPRVPKALTAGVLAAFAAMLATLAQCFFWISAYRSYNSLMPSSVANSPEMENTLIVQIVVFALLAITSLVIAAAMALGGSAAQRGRNGGRVTIWIAGGFAVTWQLCCGATGLMTRMTTDALLKDVTGQMGNDAAAFGDTLDKKFPMWQVDTAVGCGFAAGVFALLAIILIAQTPVNRYFRNLRMKAETNS